jgi:bifunctional enzyme CysN/CysC
VGEGGGGARLTSLVSPEERHQRLGQSGTVLLLAGTPSAEQEALRLERYLFDLGRHVIAVRGDAEAALALAEAGLIAILYTPVPQARLTLRDQLRDADLPWLELEPSLEPEQQVKQLQTIQEKTS